jgi:hypothetical protein
MSVLFELLTLEGWVDLVNTSLAATGWAWICHASFVRMKGTLQSCT